MYFGYRASQASTPLLAVLPALLTVTAAVVCGSLLLYALTRRFRERVRRLGRLIHLDEQRQNRMERWIGRHGAWVIIPGRLIPGLRIPTTVVTGFFNLPVRVFVPMVSVAAVVWGSLYLALGGVGQTILARAAHLHPDEPLPDAPREWLVVLLAAVIVAAAIGLLRYRRPRPDPS